MDGRTCVCRTKHFGYHRVWLSSVFRLWTATDRQTALSRLFILYSHSFLPQLIDRSIDLYDLDYILPEYETTKAPV
jgi:hypothetical protein